AALRMKGCREGPDGRLRIPRDLIAEFVSIQEKDRARAKQTGPRAEERRPISPRPVMGCAFGPGPTRYFDYDSGQTVPVNKEISTQMLKFANATPEIARVHPWFRQDASPAAGVENLVCGLKITRKLSGIDAINPKEVKYLIEVGEVVTGRARDCSYLAGSQCMTPPLILGWRAAQEMLERKKHGANHYYVATMTMIGATAPVDLASATALAAAEVLAGLVAAFVVNPEASFRGTAASTSMDMATGNVAMNAPETALLDVAVKELFDARFGGHVSAHVYYAPNAKVPGLQAVYENCFGAFACATLLNTAPHYGGNGKLDVGGVGSPVQAMLDIEILKSLASLGSGIGLCDEPVPFDDLCEMARSGRSFLTSDHTLRNFRRLWSPTLFLRRELGQDWNGTEKAILDRCNAMWKENLGRYEPPQWSAEILRGLDDVLSRARRELA
ncbi:MAG: hypothetical protein FJ279_07380, partial [Planctomycetes bacterium]|nr:hypothetical protein [Planctomycetota bacterium]